MLITYWKSKPHIHHVTTSKDYQITTSKLNDIHPERIVNNYQLPSSMINNILILQSSHHLPDGH